MKIKMSLDATSIDEAIKQITEYRDSLQRKANQLAERLASLGGVIVSANFATAVYTGDMSHNVEVETISDGKFKIIVSGECVVFVEFGSGITYGSEGTHPKAGETGFTIGSWSTGANGKGHWDDPKGWYLPKSKGGTHTYGNPPNMPVYNTAKELRRQLIEIARGVFGSD